MSFSWRYQLPRDRVIACRDKSLELFSMSSIRRVFHGFTQEHAQLLAASYARRFETGGERRARADERRRIAFKKPQPIGGPFMNQIDARRPVDCEDPGDFRGRAAHSCRRGPRLRAASAADAADICAKKNTAFRPAEKYAAACRRDRRKPRRSARARESAVGRYIHRSESARESNRRGRFAGRSNPIRAAALTRAGMESLRVDAQGSCWDSQPREPPRADALRTCRSSAP